MSHYTLGIDLGGTGIKLGLVDPSGKLRRVIRFATPGKGEARQAIEQISLHAQTLLQTTPRPKIKAIGIGVAGNIDLKRGVVIISPNLGWRHVPVLALLRRTLPYKMIIDNDAHVATWGAYVMEAKRKVPNLLCVMLGTGVGGGMIIDGKLYRGATSTAGEIGHLTLYPQGIPCACGNQGCLERYLGAKDLARAVEREIARGEKTLLTTMVQGDLEKITPLLITQAARKGDALAKRFYEQAGEHLGIALASMVNVLNPNWIVLAGGISRAGSLLLNPVKRTLRERSFPVPTKAVRLFISRHDQDLGIIGAGLMAHDA